MELMEEVKNASEVLGIVEEGAPKMYKDVPSTKKVGLNVTLNLPMDFIPGRCDLCPIHKTVYVKEVFEAEEVVTCPLNYTNVTCPMTIRKEI